MDIIQIWIGNTMPEFIAKCINSLALYSRDENIRHIIYTDNPELIHNSVSDSIVILEVPNYILDEVSKYDFKHIATKADMIRYILLKDTESEYRYYVDSDCYFTRNPFQDIFVRRGRDWFSKETRLGNYYNNTVLGAIKGSDLWKDIVELSKNKLISDSDTFTSIGPLFITDIVLNSGYPVDEEKYQWMYKSSYHLLFKAFDNDEYDDKIISNTLSNNSYGLHIFKPHGTNIDKANEVGMRLIRKIINKKGEIYEKNS